MAKIRASARPKKKGAVLRKDVREAIERVWPDGVADMTFDADESYFWEIRSQFKRAFERIGKARLLKDRFCRAVTATISGDNRRRSHVEWPYLEHEQHLL
jgi:hypothetical protein